MRWWWVAACAVALMASHFLLGAAPPPREATIFVSVASYRDPECSATLESLFANATWPRRVSVGLCVQNAPGDAACALPPREERGPVRTVRVPHERAAGPSPARFRCAALYRQEDFFMQIDSHTRFVPGWDRELLRQWRATGNPRAVLTHYPPAAMTAAVERGDLTTQMCGGGFGEDGGTMCSFTAAEVPAGVVPRPTHYAASGFLIMPRAATRAVPHDPGLSFLFWGEEVLMAARLYTHGFDLYNPSRAVCSHSYERSAAPNVYADNNAAGRPDWVAKQRRSQARVRKLLGWRDDNTQAEAGGTGDPFGVGTVRSVGEYMRRARIDWTERTMGRACT